LDQLCQVKNLRKKLNHVLAMDVGFDIKKKSVIKASPTRTGCHSVVEQLKRG